ncbi:hypothetical protein G7Y89_g11782 [Cudoniella acicularis]|uniref:Uncharacterized protein n=1 Tax=Cudoniella acicularis TaxID=354080 RepID=A0A8H4RCU8_9HELO|nr:hypothetical protein G7Y89_g11782 [Cudoniella acicularis]
MAFQFGQGQFVPFGVEAPKMPGTLPTWSERDALLRRMRAHIEGEYTACIKISAGSGKLICLIKGCGDNPQEPRNAEQERQITTLKKLLETAYRTIQELTPPKPDKTTMTDSASVDPKEFRELQSSHDYLQEQYNEIEKAHADLEAKHEELQKEKEAETIKAKQSEAKYNKEKEDNDKNYELIAERDENINRLVEQVRSLNSDVFQEKEKSAAAESERKSTFKTYQEETKKLRAAQVASARLEEQYRKTEEQIQKLNRDKTNLAKRLVEFEHAHDDAVDLRSQIAQLRSTMRRMDLDPTAFNPNLVPVAHHGGDGDNDGAKGHRHIRTLDEELEDDGGEPDDSSYIYSSSEDGDIDVDVVNSSPAASPAKARRRRQITTIVQHNTIHTVVPYETIAHNPIRCWITTEINLVHLARHWANVPFLPNAARAIRYRFPVNQPTSPSSTLAPSEDNPISDPVTPAFTPLHGSLVAGSSQPSTAATVGPAPHPPTTSQSESRKTSPRTKTTASHVFSAPGTITSSPPTSVGSQSQKGASPKEDSPDVPQMMTQVEKSPSESSDADGGVDAPSDSAEQAAGDIGSLPSGPHDSRGSVSGDGSTPTQDTFPPEDKPTGLGSGDDASQVTGAEISPVEGEEEVIEEVTEEIVEKIVQDHSVQPTLWEEITRPFDPNHTPPVWSTLISFAIHCLFYWGLWFCWQNFKERSMWKEANDITRGVIDDLFQHRRKYGRGITAEFFSEGLSSSIEHLILGIASALGVERQAYPLPG